MSGKVHRRKTGEPKKVDRWHYYSESRVRTRQVSWICLNWSHRPRPGLTSHSRSSSRRIPKTLSWLSPRISRYSAARKPCESLSDTVRLFVILSFLVDTIVHQCLCLSQSLHIHGIHSLSRPLEPSQVDSSLSDVKYLTSVLHQFSAHKHWRGACNKQQILLVYLEIAKVGNLYIRLWKSCHLRISGFDSTWLHWPAARHRYEQADRHTSPTIKWIFPLSCSCSSFSQHRLRGSYVVNRDDRDS